MQSTTQTRLTLAKADAELLDQVAALYGTMKRKLYARMAAHGGNAKSHKTAFCREHGISARMFNAMAIELQGLIDGTRELLKEERRSLQGGIGRLERQYRTRKTQLDEIAADRLRLKPLREAKLRRTVHQNTCRLERLNARLTKVEQRLEANVPGICFGTRKLFGQQHHLKLAGFSNREAWLREWQSSRSHQVFFVGSKDETAGNQLCQLQKATDGTYTLKIRLPDRLLAAGEAKSLIIADVTFGYDREALDAALEAGIALSWRLHRDERGWRAFVSFNYLPAQTVSLDAKYGAVGLDFNVDHLAVTETDAFGNLLYTKRLPLLREDASSGQRNAVLSDALSIAVAWAKDARKPVVAEDLDFTAKKKAMAQLSPKGARMLSGLLYAKYRQLLEAKCFRAGVELIKINPAYTSTIGAVKYASRRGWSVHAAAAGVIARRGQKLTERAPRVGTVIRVPVRGGHHALELPARKGQESREAVWRKVHTAYRGVVRERWLATRGGLPRRSAKGTHGSGARAAPLSRDNRLPCEIKLREQICAR
ncbi:transposase [Burkholderia sp. Ax-1719]|uniref:transposase n=1 Tax=Burkholderia sp. Ax-1719 TaxID=2608334 RepID=UPI00142483EE|nr:transposase [Burkholderia sp. Ax-1719]NIE63125.1 IS200/IS605 family element transposase accessory protein TnpB [Burkholderia sp. Ax-1719]